MEREGDRTGEPFGGGCGHLQYRFVVRRLAGSRRRSLQHHLLSDDQRDQLLGRDVGDPFATHGDAVAKHGDPVTHLHHLVDAMRDEEDRHAALAELAKHREQASHLVRRQAGRRLVQDDGGRVVGESGSDCDHGAGRNRQRGHLPPYVDVDPETVEHPPGMRPDLAPPDEPRRQRIAGQQRDVLRDAEIGERNRLLVDERQPRAAGARARIGAGRSTPEDQLAPVRLVEPGQDPDQR